jgi:hypothetical protein
MRDLLLALWLVVALMAIVVFADAADRYVRTCQRPAARTPAAPTLRDWLPRMPTVPLPK